MGERIVVVTDSAASLPADVAAEHGIVVIPLSVIVDGEVFDEGVSISSGQVLDALEGGAAVSTSQPATAAFTQAYRDAEAAGAESVVMIALSAHLSGTVASARAAAREVSIPVDVVDSGSVAMATGFAAMAAARAVRAGYARDRVVEIARQVAESAVCVFTVDTLEYLRRGGRISSAAATVGRMLSVKPVLEITDGQPHVTHKVRSTARARDAVLVRAEAAVDAAADPAVAVMTLGEPSFGDDAVRALRMHHHQLSALVTSTVSSVLAVHSGPGALAVVVADMAPLAVAE